MDSVVAEETIVQMSRGAKQGYLLRRLAPARV
jgi:hypothetical protein